MIVHALWHGGSGYTWGDPHDDLERFDTMREAVQAFRERRDSNGMRRVTFNYVNRERDTVLCPCVGDDACMVLYFTDDGGGVSDYPDRMLTFGPRGAVNAERV